MENEATSTVPEILEFFLLMGRLKDTQRTGWVLRDIQPCESVADHMYRMAIMAFLLGRKEGSELDRDRCIKMALVHDMAESIVGDLTPHCGVTKEEKHRRESEAMKRISSLVDENTRKEFLELYEEYELQETAEAKAVKNLDKFDMILQAFEYERRAGHSISLEFLNVEATFNAENTDAEVLTWINALKRVRDKERNSSHQKAHEASDSQQM